MATWTAPSTAVTGALIPAAYGNSDIRDNSQYLYDEKLFRDGSIAVTGTMNWADQILQRPVIKDYAESLTTNATSGATATLDLENGNVFDVTLTANCTFTFSNPPATGKAGSFTLILRQDGTGSRTATWPAAVKWQEGLAPEISTAASAIDVMTFFTRDAGTTWFGFLAGQGMA